jgi:hypothetical protein
MTDEELKAFLKSIHVDATKIDHAFSRSGTWRACISCSYVIDRCWLCEQCVSCCEYSVESASVELDL